MKKLIIAFAAISLLPAAAYAAAEMDCCKDCACCKGKKEGHEQSAPAPKPQ